MLILQRRVRQLGKIPAGNQPVFHVWTRWPRHRRSNGRHGAGNRYRRGYVLPGHLVISTRVRVDNGGNLLLPWNNFQMIFFTEVFYVYTITMTMNKGQFSKTVITMVPGAAQTIIPAQTSISSICLLFQSRKMAAHSWNWSSLSRTKGRLYLSPWGNIQITTHNHY